MSKGVKAVLTIIVLAVIAVVVLFWTGLLEFESSGGFDAPDVNVSGGDLPQVELKTGRVAVGSEKAAVDVPRVAVDRDRIEVNVPTINIETSDDEE